MKKFSASITLITALAVVAFAAATTNLNKAVNGQIALSTEPVEYAGVVHAVTQVKGNSCAPVDPCRVFVNLAGVNGVGVTSGGVYQFVGAASADLVTSLPGDVSVVVRGFRAVPPNPISPTDPCRLRVRLALDGEGVATLMEAELQPESCGVDTCP